MIRGTIKVEGLKEATDKLRQVEKKMVKQKKKPREKSTGIRGANYGR
jgi:hypothetical protein